MKRRTIVDRIDLVGIEPYGGNQVVLSVRPSQYPGLRFFTPDEKPIISNLYTAQEKRYAISLVDKDYEIGHVEHIHGALLGMGVDNADIHLSPLKNNFEYALSIVPNFEERERTLCEAIRAVGLMEVEEELKLFKVNKVCGNKWFKISPHDYDNISITVSTKYSDERKRGFGIEITPEFYESKVSHARSYVKQIHPIVPKWLMKIGGHIVYPHIGLGNGVRDNLFLYPERKHEDFIKKQEENGILCGFEIATHGINDRAGAIKILENTLGGKIIGTHFSTFMSGHANDLRSLIREARNFVRVD